MIIILCTTVCSHFTINYLSISSPTVLSSRVVFLFKKSHVAKTSDKSETITLDKRCSYDTFHQKLLTLHQQFLIILSTRYIDDSYTYRVNNNNNNNNNNLFRFQLWFWIGVQKIKLFYVNKSSNLIGRYNFGDKSNQLNQFAVSMDAYPYATKQHHSSIQYYKLQI